MRIESNPAPGGTYNALCIKDEGQCQSLCKVSRGSACGSCHLRLHSLEADSPKHGISGNPSKEEPIGSGGVDRERKWTKQWKNTK